MLVTGPVIKLETHRMILKCETKVHINLQELSQNRLFMKVFREQPDFSVKMFVRMRTL